jgi:AcrR family transcriptional regulator
MSGLAPPQLRQLTPRAAEILSAARVIIEAGGPEALTMRSLGERMSMKAPSLYKHFSSKAALYSAIIDSTFLELGGVLHEAVARAHSSAAVAAVLEAYRGVALAHPNLYRLCTVGYLDRDGLTPGIEDWAGQPFVMAAGNPNLAQALFSFAHGMVVLELDNRFPPSSDLDSTWSAGIAAFSRH